MSTAQDTGPVYVLLADGTTVEIREARPDDFGAARAMHEAMAPDNIYMRFFSYSGGSARLLYWRPMECFIDGRLPGAVAQLDRLAHLPVTSGEVLRRWSPRATRGHALAFLGRGPDGLAEIDETLARARAARHPSVEAECLWHRAEALAAPGQAPRRWKRRSRQPTSPPASGRRNGPLPRTAIFRGRGGRRLLGVDGG